MAGAPGFEPGITGPKPVALPLGHAPLTLELTLETRCGTNTLPAVAEERPERHDHDHSEQHDRKRRHECSCRDSPR